MNSSGGKRQIPWVEKYRPTDFRELVLSKQNATILGNILYQEYFPNMLFYGPPGTGKTTTIVNLIEAYQKKKGQLNQGLILHLNASDDRGIDIIRNQISAFVNAKSILGGGIKFVILDEVDYMTKGAQQALRYLLHDCPSTVRFSLICNYISKIEEALQNEFVKLKFNRLPLSGMKLFLKRIACNEGFDLSEDAFEYMEKQYASDLRSMINFMQINKESTNDCKIVGPKSWLKLINYIKQNENIGCICSLISEISRTHNIDKNSIIKDFIYFLILNYSNKFSQNALHELENCIHSIDINEEYLIRYCVSIIISEFNNQ